MKKITLLIAFITIGAFGWEINTHRAIDKKAIEESKISGNLKMFVENSGIPTDENNYNNEQFEDYNMSYIKYIEDDKNGEGNGITQWGQEFSGNPSYQNMIEAGTILEDAQWPNSDRWNGRFNNHFYEAQNGGQALNIAGFRLQDALTWTRWGVGNDYSHKKALDYYHLAFSESTPDQRRKYQAKMLVSVGHILHMLNDMSVPAHVRADTHPLGDPLEVWMRGGEDGNSNSMGYHVAETSTIGSVTPEYVPQRTYSNIKDYITVDARYTSENFFSRDSIFKGNYHPTKQEITYSEPNDIGGGVTAKYILNKQHIKIATEIDSYTLTRFVGYMQTKCPLQGDFSVLKDTGKVLIGRAIANATGFLNYFFRGSIDATCDSSGELTITNTSDTSLVAAGATVFNGGNFEVYYDDSTGTRTKLKDCPATGVQTTCNIFAELSGKDATNLTILYDGTIGSERGLAVKVIDAPVLGGGAGGGGTDAGDGTDPSDFDFQAQCSDITFPDPIPPELEESINEAISGASDLVADIVCPLVDAAVTLYNSTHGGGVPGGGGLPGGVGGG